MTTLPVDTAIPPDDSEPLRHARRTLLISALATLATFLDTTILFVAFPDIVETFSGAGASELSWVLNGYTIVFAALLVPAGKLADRQGHKRAFLLGSTVFTVASMFCGIATSVELLIGFRLLQAAGAAILIPSSLALIMRAFPRERIPQAVAIWGAAGAVAGALGPTFGAGIVEALGWRWAFFINLPVGVFTVVAGRRHLHESSDPETRVPSVLGVVLIASAAAVTSYAVVESDRFGWGSARTGIVLAVGVTLFAAFILQQRRTSAPALDLELFRIGNFSWGNLSAFAFGLAFSAMFFGSILFLTQVWGWSILKAGFGVAPGPALVALLAPRFGKWAGQIGQRPFLLVGGLFYAAGGLHRVVFLDADVAYLTTYLPSMLLTGIGVACCLPQLSSLIAQALPANRIGVGGAVLQAVRQFGGTFGVALTVAMLGAPSGLTDALIGFDRVWTVIIVGGLATTLLAIPLRTRPTLPSGASA
ncbi:DHA2 family efflux MFS transporter permease subunit [Ilumatobacter nonamiensis]|uniref:DHA2 family efflux MFS transporter permease subunit n=1 Tax=Ilumatobacter nonamiensis TaxID=467093 RepID=UPI0003473664|nr:DHA2 family efflux MFS transporter permease subunit [Ilumatobacter nonamiensis]